MPKARRDRIRKYSILSQEIGLNREARFLVCEFPLGDFSYRCSEICRSGFFQCPFLIPAEEKKRLCQRVVLKFWHARESVSHLEGLLKWNVGPHSQFLIQEFACLTSSQVLPHFEAPGVRDAYPVVSK